MDELKSVRLNMSIPFAFGWYGSELGAYRPCKSTYEVYSYESLPPIPKADPQFTFLALDEPVEKAPPVNDWERAEWRKLERLIQETKSLGIVLPDPFLHFMSDARLQGQIISSTCCWFNLSNRLVRCPGFDGAYLISFLRDQQDCVVWCLCLIPGRQYYVLAVDDDALMTLSSAEYHVLLGNLEPDEESGDIFAEASRASSADNVAETARTNIWICAPSFESFIYRFWFENEVANKFDPCENTLLAPLSDAERRYLEHYTG